jgi:hypothetical protein
MSEHVLSSHTTAHSVAGGTLAAIISAVIPPSWIDPLTRIVLALPVGVVTGFAIAAGTALYVRVAARLTPVPKKPAP